MLKFYNTRSRQKEDFMPLATDTVSIYTCGPTVYAQAHIGNLRAYLFMDSLRRILRRNGYTLRHCMNITDVGHLTDDGDDGEDKMSAAAKKQRLSPWDIAKHYTELFMRDMEALHIDLPEIITPATGYIDDMIDFVQALQDKGYAYEIDDGVYFDISKFPEYGQLARLNLDEQKAGARVEVNNQKRNPFDFALWKKAEPSHIMQWPSPWGQGYPGWHIECSAISRHHLGDMFDIHTGGEDHIPVHHENEIAQSCALLGHAGAKLWMHNAFLQVDGGKMGKSLGNAYTLDDLRDKGYAPVHYRYLCTNAHYRSKCNFTWDGIAAAKTAQQRYAATIKAHQGKTSPDLDIAQLEAHRTAFDEALNDDLNLPKALGIAHTTAKLPFDDRVYQALLSFDEVLQLLHDAPNDEIKDLPAEITTLLEQRANARSAKDWAQSDSLRDTIAAAGYTVKDTANGQECAKS
ncbi:MAG: cysteine--tRNA ligase [Oscillospiraceae bacterium]|nr:cysteine--tRNA ligase [Oscillospiraceae bacterium]